MKLSRPQAAIDNLTKHQVQCDDDGVMVQVSRQALDEVLAYLALPRAVEGGAVDCSCAKAGFPGSCHNCDADSGPIKFWREQYRASCGDLTKLAVEGRVVEEALDNSQSLLAMIYQLNTKGSVSERDWEGEGLADLITKQLQENRAALSHPNTGDGYDPAFVEEIKRTDELPPEALFDNGPDMLAWLNHPSDGGVAGDDDCEDQACPPTDRCTKFKCDNAELVLRGKYWRCPNCGASYGEYPFHGGVAGEPVAMRNALARALIDLKACREITRHTMGEPHGLNQTIEIIETALALPPVPGNEGREAIIEKCAGIVDRWIGDITKAGDQFDKGGDIYSHANVLQGVAASIRGLSHSRSERS